MALVLLICVRFHDGRYHGAGDWPPSPARLFQALVAAAAKSALDRTSREALAWLEKQAAPVIAAPAARLGQHVSLFVPNNDLDAKGGDIRRVAEIRSATKHIRPRLFDQSVPLLYLWRCEDDEKSRGHAKGICTMAGDLYQLGRGVDMAWAVGETLDEVAVETRLTEYPGSIHRPSPGGRGTTLDCPEEGSLASLELRYAAGATRFWRASNRIEFANAPRPRFRSVAYDCPATRLLFELRRTTASGSPFAPWPLAQAAALVQRLRGNDGSDGLPENGAFARLAGHSDRGTLNRILIGRDAGEADKALRIRIVPLPSIGHVHADRGIRRVLVEVPPDCPIPVADVAWAFSGLEIESPMIDAQTGEILSSPVELVPADDESMLEHYGIGECTPSRRWRSVTPVALPESVTRRRTQPARMCKDAKGGAERLAEEQRATHAIVQSLRHVGIRESAASVRVQREPFDAKGANADGFAAGTRFAKARLRHVEIAFAAPIRGPLVMGDGRYAGLGVMAPLRENLIGVHAFSIVDGLSEDARIVDLAHALRRAVMARVQACLPDRKARLDMFFTGHEDDGAPARRGGHAHLAFIPDLERQRLLVVAPHLVEHRNATQRESKLLSLLDRALTGFDELCAGRSGKLRLASSTLAAEFDPLFAASKRWTSSTPYVATRYPKRDVEEFLRLDALAEVQRRGLPNPVMMRSRRLASDQAIEASLSLTFEIAVPGPILLGRNLHFGGGLLHAHP